MSPIRPREAFAAGRLRIDQVRVIVKAAERAAGVSGEQVAAGRPLVAKATGGLTVDRSTRDAWGRGAADVRDDPRPSPADRHESAVDRRVDRAEAETWCTPSDNGDGTYAGRFVIPELHALILNTALDRRTAPRTPAPAGPDRLTGGW